MMRVLVVADDPLARAGLTALLRDVDEVDVVGQGRADDMTPSTYAPDAVVWDVGWDPTVALADTAPVEWGLPLVALLPDAPTATAAATVLGAQDVAYALLSRGARADALVAAIGAVIAGLVALEALLLQPELLLPRGPADAQATVEALTTREAEVLGLLAEGLPNKLIAARLHISEHTVKFHVNAIMSKLGAGSRTEAVVRATRLGLITL